MPGKFLCAAGSRWAITNLQPTGISDRDRESQPFRPGSLFQLPNPHPVDPPVDNDLGMLAIADIAAEDADANLCQYTRSPRRHDGVVRIAVMPLSDATLREIAKVLPNHVEKALEQTVQRRS